MSKKISFTFVLRELLTPQQHYDWGLRALKTVLKACGNLLQQEKRSQEKNKGRNLRLLCYNIEHNISEEKAEFGYPQLFFSSRGKENVQLLSCIKFLQSSKIYRTIDKS